MATEFNIGFMPDKDQPHMIFVAQKKGTRIKKYAEDGAEEHNENHTGAGQYVVIKREVSGWSLTK